MKVDAYSSKYNDFIIQLSNEARELSQDDQISFNLPEKEPYQIFIEDRGAPLPKEIVTKDPLKIEAPTIKIERLYQTIEALKKIFGEERVQRALKEASIDLPSLYKNSLTLTKKELISLFYHLSLLTSFDMVDLLREFQEDKDSVRGIEGEELLQLKKNFLGKTTIQSCSETDLDFLAKILLPFPLPSDLFWNFSKKGREKLDFPPQPESPIEQAAWSNFVLREHNLPTELWEVEFAKKVSHIVTKQGLLVRHPKGWLVLEHRIEEAGVSKSFFASLQPSTLPSIVSYRGTRIPFVTGDLKDGIAAILDDLTAELGSRGPVATYQATQKIFNDPNGHFSKVQLIGYSLGGAQAQRDCVLFLRNVVKLSTICSPAIDQKTTTLFNDLVSPLREGLPPLEISKYEEEGDMVSFVGEKHLGADCKSPDVHLSAHRAISLTDQKPSHESVWPDFGKAPTFLSMLSETCTNLFGNGAHSRESAPYSVQIYTLSSHSQNQEDAKKVQDIFSHRAVDERWEIYRKKLSGTTSEEFAAFAEKMLFKT